MPDGRPARCPAPGQPRPRARRPTWLWRRGSQRVAGRRRKGSSRPSTRRSNHAWGPRCRAGRLSYPLNHGARRHAIPIVDNRPTGPRGDSGPTMPRRRPPDPPRPPRAMPGPPGCRPGQCAHSPQGSPARPPPGSGTAPALPKVEPFARRGVGSLPEGRSLWKAGTARTPSGHSPSGPTITSPAIPYQFVCVSREVSLSHQASVFLNRRAASQRVTHPMVARATI